jgi:hypothetical protein
VSHAFTRIYIGDVKEQDLERKFASLRTKFESDKMGRKKGNREYFTGSFIFVNQYQLDQIEKGDVSRTCSMRGIY